MEFKLNFKINLFSHTNLTIRNSIFLTLKSRSFYDKTLFANLFLPIDCGRFAFKGFISVCQFGGFA
ncbi:hypothetical protein LEP1GSC074_0099 [Leptospira noguchii str. Hook]|nr:hypothetical protein LEP1GSC074_0099 [Leptospira noguchii str. Hook]